MAIRSDCIQRPLRITPIVYMPPNGQQYKVRDRDSWVTLAQRHNMDPWALIRYNYPDLPAGTAAAAREVNWYLQEYVGCKVLTADRKNYVFSASANPGLIYVPGPAPVPVQANYNRSRRVIPYIYGEMIANANSKAVAEIKRLNTSTGREEFPFTGEPGESAARAGMIISNQIRAALKWKDLVKTNAVWDHKPHLRRMLGLRRGDMHFPIEGDANHEWFYDIWSNIHYGYVGRAAGFTGSILQWGHQRGGSAGKSDPVDVVTVQMGIDLWDRHGLKLTQGQFHQAILARRNTILQLQGTEKYRKAVGRGFNHIEPLTDGR